MGMPKLIYVYVEPDGEEDNIWWTEKELLETAEDSMVELEDPENGDLMAVYELKGYAKVTESTDRKITPVKK